MGIARPVAVTPDQPHIVQASGLHVHINPDSSGHGTALVGPLVHL